MQMIHMEALYIDGGSVRTTLYSLEEADAWAQRSIAEPGCIAVRGRNTYELEWLFDEASGMMLPDSWEAVTARVEWAGGVK